MSDRTVLTDCWSLDQQKYISKDIGTDKGILNDGHNFWFDSVLWPPETLEYTACTTGCRNESILWKSKWAAKAHPNTTSLHQGGRSCTWARVAPAESLDSDENFKPEHTLFCREFRFVAISALFGDLWAKKSAFLGQKQCFLGKKCTITWYILHISLS